MTSHPEQVLLGQLNPGETGIIISIGANRSSPTETELTAERRSELTRRLLQIGFVEGATVEVSLQAPFSRDPIAVRVRGAQIALRRNEADLITVQRTNSSQQPSSTS